MYSYPAINSSTTALFPYKPLPSMMPAAVPLTFYEQVSFYPHQGKQPSFNLQVRPASPLTIGKPAWLDLQLNNSTTFRPPNLQIVHEKLAHIFIVNQDLSDFQHVHPDVIYPGLLRIPVNFKTPGTYKLFIQFTTPAQGEQTLNKSFQLSVPPLQKPMVPDAHLPKFIDGYTFRVSNLPTQAQPMSMFKVEVLKNGLSVGNIQPYLGAGAHGVILSQDMESFVHTHPMTEAKGGFYQSPIQFHTQIDKPGLYKMWIQTKIDGQVHTVDWTFKV
jgi:hypothetical protein